MSEHFGRVLIVDDERHVREVLRDFLTSMGDEVATAASAAEALELVPTFQPDVILTDMKMPGAAPQSSARLVSLQFPDRSSDLEFARPAGHSILAAPGRGLPRRPELPRQSMSVASQETCR